MTDDADNKKLHRLMSLYDESAESAATLNDETAPIYSKLKPGEMPFQIESLIARGGVKSIFKVFNPKTAHYVAMARLNPDSPEELYEPFLREARLTAQLDHPNIITIYDIGLNTDSTPYFIMELKTGDRLDTVIEQSFPKRRKKLDGETIANLLNIFLKICDAMEYAHSQNVVHLDLKPQNIQVGKYGEVVVCDWGNGKLIGDKKYDGGDFDRLLLNPDLLNNMTLTGQIKGTPGFMAPEQITNQGEKNQSTDIYSLGAILYTILTNALPVDGKTPDDLLENTRKGRIIPPAERCPGSQVPPALSAIALKAMARSPKQRYASVREMRQDLVNYLNGFSTSAENAGFFKEVRLFYRRQKKILNVSALAFGILFIAVAVSYLSIHKSRQAAIEAKIRLQHETEERLKLGEEAAPQYYEKAVNQLSQGHLKQAVRNLETAVVLYPRDIEYHNLLASLYFIQGRHEEADRMFWEYPQSIYKMVFTINQTLLQKTAPAEEEFRQIKALLESCGQIKTTPLTTALFARWALDERRMYRNLALENLRLENEQCTAMLNYAAEQKNTDAAQTLIFRVLQTLQASPEWIGRRIPATRGTELSCDPKLKMQFENLIPANLALGQPFTNLGGIRSNPQNALDGIIAEDNYWSAAPLPAEINVDLGGVHMISKIKVFTNGFAPVAKNFRYDVVAISSQPGEPKIVATRTQNDDRNSTCHLYEFPPTPAEFVRLKIIYHSGDIPIQIREFEVY